MSEQPPEELSPEEVDRRGLLGQLWALPLADLQDIVAAYWAGKIPKQKQDPWSQ